MGLLGKRKRAGQRAPRRVRRRKTLMKPRGLRMTSMMTKRTFYNGSWSFGTVTTDQFWRYFSYSMSNLPNFNAYTSLFDEFRINGIKITFRPRYDSISTPSVTDGTSQPVITQPQAYAHVIIDPDSGTTPGGVYSSANLNTFLAAGDRVKSYTLNKPFSVYFKPKVRDFIQGGGNTSRSMRAPWIRSTDTSVTHNGVHVFLQQNNFSVGANYVILDMFVTYYFQTRQPRS